MQDMSMKVHYYTREHKITPYLYPILQQLDQLGSDGRYIQNIRILVQTPERKSQLLETQAQIK
jgi:hypothetical protein